MKTVLFCGGHGTRIRDYAESIPKPMIPIGDKPILWHLMHYSSQYGHKNFALSRLQGERHQGVFPELPAAHLRGLCGLRLWAQYRDTR
jgi:NDP-sugar pyrophosphorylase family protein